MNLNTGGSIFILTVFYKLCISIEDFTLQETKELSAAGVVNARSLDVSFQMTFVHHPGVLQAPWSPQPKGMAPLLSIYFPGRS